MHADIQAVYCDRRWQAGLKSKATSLFDVGRSMFPPEPFGGLDVHLFTFELSPMSYQLSAITGMRRDTILLPDSLCTTIQALYFFKGTNE